MPGFELVGKEEQAAINKLFDREVLDLDRNISVKEFEAAVAKRVGAVYGQATSSGSAACKVALQGVGVKAGDEVITTAFTFVATIEAILEVGAKPVIVDVDDSLNISAPAIEKAITSKTTCIMPVHMQGCPADMDAIMAVAKKHNLKVVEDACQALGAIYKGKHCGTIGDAGAFSFDSGKVITTGEGGMVVTNSEEVYVRARSFHDHGHEYNTKGIPRGREGALGPGFNYRMSEIQGAIGMAQLNKLDMILKTQRSNKAKLKNEIKDFPVTFKTIHDKEGEAGDTLVFFCKTSDQAAKFAQGMISAGMWTKNLPDALTWHFAKRWKHLYEYFGFYKNEWQQMWNQSQELLERAIALPVMVKYTDAQIADIGEKLRKIAKEVL